MLNRNRPWIHDANSSLRACVRSFFNDLLQDRLVQREVPHDTREPRILLGQLAEHAQFAPRRGPRSFSSRRGRLPR